MLSTAANALVCQHLAEAAPRIADQFRSSYKCDPGQVNVSLKDLVSSYSATIFANSLVYKHLSKVTPHLMKDFKMLHAPCKESLDDLFVLYEKINFGKRNTDYCGDTPKIKLKIEDTENCDVVDSGDFLDTEFTKELEKYHPCFASSECESDIENEVYVLSQEEKSANEKTSLKRPKKRSLVLENVTFDEQKDGKEAALRFSSKVVKLNKTSQVSKPYKGTAFVAPLKSNSVKYKNSQKKKASDIFDTSDDDPDVIEILKREKAEAKNVSGNAKKGSKFVNGVQQMMQFSQTLGHRKRNRFPKDCFDKEFESPVKRQRHFDEEDLHWKSAMDVSKSKAPSPPLNQRIEPLPDSPDSIPMSPSLMISPVLPRKLAYFEVNEIEDDFDNDSNEYVPDLDELLKLPERPADGSKTKDEILDELDRQIAERQRLHEEEMAKVEAEIEAQNQKRIQRKLRLKKNAKLRNRLETELTETRLRSMFEDNLQYLRDIWSGKVDSWRHQAFHKSIRTRHALYYTIITDPFTDDQLDWTLDEISKVWMSTRRDELDNKEYVWKVLLAECFIKFYMDFFNVSKHEAMTRISETPLHKKDRLKEFMSKSDEEESEEDLL